MARKKKSKGLRVSLMLTVGLMIVSFAAGDLNIDHQMTFPV